MKTNLELAREWFGVHFSVWEEEDAPAIERLTAILDDVRNAERAMWLRELDEALNLFTDKHTWYAWARRMCEKYGGRK